jgi:multicomponent Na+:H+ antiporter subunit G
MIGFGDILILVFAIIGVFFNALGSLGLLRFPDVYTRLHAGTKCTTFGTIFTVLAVVCYSLWRWIAVPDPRWVVISVHSIIAVMFLLLANPVGAHAIARAARKIGIRPYGAVVDEMEGMKND